MAKKSGDENLLFFIVMIIFVAFFRRSTYE